MTGGVCRRWKISRTPQHVHFKCHKTKNHIRPEWNYYFNYVYVHMLEFFFFREVMNCCWCCVCVSKDIRCIIHLFQHKINISPSVLQRRASEWVSRSWCEWCWNTQSKRRATRRSSRWCFCSEGYYAHFERTDWKYPLAPASPSFHRITHPHDTTWR